MVGSLPAGKAVMPGIHLGRSPTVSELEQPRESWFKAKSLRASKGTLGLSPAVQRPPTDEQAWLSSQTDRQAGLPRVVSQ